MRPSSSDGTAACGVAACASSAAVAGAAAPPIETSSIESCVMSNCVTARVPSPLDVLQRPGKPAEAGERGHELHGAAHVRPGDALRPEGVALDPVDLEPSGRGAHLARLEAAPERDAGEVGAGRGDAELPCELR